MTEEWDPIDVVMAADPPETAEEIALWVGIFLKGLSQIEAHHIDNPLWAAKDVIQVTIRFIAGMSPAGQVGPGVRTLATLLETVLEIASGDRASLSEYGSPPRKNRPTRHRLSLGRALGAALMTLLMDAGMDRKSAKEAVARELVHQKVPLGRGEKMSQALSRPGVIGRQTPTAMSPFTGLTGSCFATSGLIFWRMRRPTTPRS